jgi:serine/threonine-protein kinase
VQLGEGGMARVFRAVDQRYGTNVALKLLRREYGGSLMSRLFAREVRISIELSHPNILPVLDAGEFQGLPFYVMPVIEGMTLEGVIDDVGRMAIADAIRIAGDVATALSYAHSRQVIHRDIKPANILLADGHALVADFGIARHFDTDPSGKLTDSGMAIGTAPYMSPEQASSTDLDGRADQYSLACMLFEMLCGEPPYGAAATQATLERHAHEPIPSVRDLRHEVPAALDSAIRQALAKHPRDRFADAADFKAAIEAAAPPAQGTGWFRALRAVFSSDR